MGLGRRSGGSGEGREFGDKVFRGVQSVLSGLGTAGMGVLLHGTVTIIEV